MELFEQIGKKVTDAGQGAAQQAKLPAGHTWGDYKHVVDLWMDSKGHRENIMESSYTKAVAARNGSCNVLLPG